MKIASFVPISNFGGSACQGRFPSLLLQAAMLEVFKENGQTRLRIPENVWKNVAKQK